MKVIKTRQPILNVLCRIWSNERNIKHHEINGEGKRTSDNTGRTIDPDQILCRIIKIGKDFVQWKQELPKDGYYGFFDRPELFEGMVKLSDISLIEYFEPVTLAEHPNLSEYRVKDKVLVSVSNHRTGKNEFREGLVTGIHTINPNRGERFKPYPMVFVKTIFTYWKGDSNGNGEFYDKENICGVIMEKELKNVTFK